ncbi:hypothetical protein KL925_000099 [Ogataea polymorpha]|nr:hypothetical protein KL925_000099 [Ogataea polymorpha]
MKRVRNSQRYRDPLPIGVTALSPLSWALAAVAMAWQFWTYKPEIDEKFRVYGPDMLFLWNHGFFGKGILSRSEPTWLERTRRRVLGQRSSYTDEEMVAQRRKARSQFKQKRKQLDELENFYKRKNDRAGLEEVEKKRHELTLEQPERVQVIRSEDKELIVGSDIQQLEYVQLMPEEVLFLQILDCVRTNTDFVSLFRSLASKEFCLRFLVYYYYRTLGWVVKSGLKFSCDFILYERGPVFQHSQYAVKIATPGTWLETCSMSRVVGSVKKKLILVFVRPPPDFDQRIKCLTDKKSVFALLNDFILDEISFKRWSAARERE